MLISLMEGQWCLSGQGEDGSTYIEEEGYKN